MFNARELARLQAEMTPIMPCLAPPELQVPVTRQAEERQEICWSISLKLLVWIDMMAALYAMGISLTLKEPALAHAVLYPSAAFGLLLLLHALKSRAATLALLPWVGLLPWICTCNHVGMHWGACVWLSLALVGTASGRLQRVSSMFTVAIVAMAGLSLNKEFRKVRYDFITLFLLVQGLLALFPFHSLTIRVHVEKK